MTADTPPKKFSLKSIASLVLIVVGYLAAQYFGLLPKDGESKSSGGTATAERGTQTAPKKPASNQTSKPASKPTSETGEPASAPKVDSGVERVKRAFANQEFEVMVELAAEVVKTLPDDNDGSRHQRFLLEVDRGLTVLVAHNIDLAPRVPLQEGDTVRIYGQYEWNDKGGVLHWTHHDPKGWHEDGWIELDGKIYK